MAERVQINPRVSVATRVALDEAVKVRGCSMGDVLDAAVGAFLSGEPAPHSGDVAAGVAAQMQQVVLEHIKGLREQIGQVAQAQHDVMEILIGLMEVVKEQAKAADNDDTLLPVQGPDELYGPPETWAPQPLVFEPLPPPKRSFWNRMFYKEVSS